MKLVITLFTLSLALSHSHAQVPFAEALSQARLQILKTQSQQRQVRLLDTASDLRRLSSDIRRERWDIERLERTLRDLQRRAQNLERLNPGRNPNDPRRDTDPFLSSDLRRFVWDLKSETRELESIQRDIERVERAAQKDPALVAPAQALESDARWLKNSTDDIG